MIKPSKSTSDKNYIMMKYRITLSFIAVSLIIGKVQSVSFAAIGDTSIISFSKMPEVLPKTNPLTWEGDLSAKMMDGAHRFVEKKIDESIINRSKLWDRNFSSKEAYELSVEPNRKRLMKYTGVEDKSTPLINYCVGLEDKNPPISLQRFSENNDPEIIAETKNYRIYQVRWPVLNRVSGEGLLLQPKTKPLANIIALPDADQTPEQIAGLSPGIPAESQFARRLAENGYQVLIPVLIGRKLLFEGEVEQYTYRERIYRQAFEMGRHVIGYEVQKVMSAVDWFKQSSGSEIKIGVAGYCEGGLIAFYTAALDKRIDAVFVSGYFNNRQKVWDEPIYRNVWGLLTEFGDAEIVSLIAPRPIVIEYSAVPEIVDRVERFQINPPIINGIPFTGYKGKISTPPFKDVQTEFNRIEQLIKPGFQQRILISGKENKPVGFGSKDALERLSQILGHASSLPLSNEAPADSRSSFNPEERQLRQVKEMEDHVQWLVRDAGYERNRLFLYKVMPEFGISQSDTRSYHKYYSPIQFIEQCKDYREYFREEFLGNFNETLIPANPRTRKVYDKERWTGYEVVLDVYQDLFAWGFILIPKDIKPGERRPVVVVQHGRSRIPQIMIEGNSTGYNDVAAKLADKGFIVFAPHNLYRGEDLYRWLTRKANTLKKSLYSFIIPQHEQLLQWLGTLPYVDKSRIGFYGLSFGGASAMRLPSVLEGYSVSICSGDFGDYTRRVADTHYAGSTMQSGEWEWPVFDMGNHFNYAEMAYLIFPRPFMVERGHDDDVQPDEMVGSEYAKIKYLYDQFNCKDKTEIEYFNGGHSMRCEGTFTFLKKHLNWP
jgi:dienelactone hydrolase